MSGRFLRLPAVKESTGLSRSTIQRMIAAGTFPKSYRLTEGTVMWTETDIEAWKAKVLGGTLGGTASKHRSTKPAKTEG